MGYLFFYTSKVKKIIIQLLYIIKKTNFIKFDGIEVENGVTYLIDAKTNIPYFLKLKETGVEIGILYDALFTLFPVMYFNEECYEKLIKVSKEELLKRLEGKAKKVLLLEIGIYIIFNDKADISYEEFVEMNETFKPLLGLI